MREVIQSVLEDYHDDDLSIVNEDEEHTLDGNSSMGGGPEKNQSKNAPLDLVRRETRAVSVCRYIIMALFVIGGVLLSLGTLRWVTEAQPTSETSCFLTGHDLPGVFAHLLERNLMHRLHARFMATFSVSASLTSFVLSRKNEDQAPVWPRVTIPHFDAQLTGILESSMSDMASAYGAQQARLAPLVLGALKTTFEDYAIDEQLNACSSCEYIPKIINSEIVGEDGMTAPIWQTAPFSAESMKMFNLFSIPSMATSIRNMLILKAGVISDYEAVSEEQQQKKDDGPNLSLVYPVFQDFQKVEIAAALNIIYEWRDILEESVPFEVSLSDGSQDETSNGVIFSLLLESCSGQVDSFSITGMNVTYDGRKQAITDSIKKKSEMITVPGGYDYGSSEPLSSSSGKDMCNYKIWLVPSDEFLSAIREDDTDVRSDEAILYTCLVGALFGLLIFCFLVYDWLMEKRQSVVSNIATKSNAIVENLFPATVRNRILGGLSHSQRPDDQEKPVDAISKSLRMDMGGVPGPVSVKQFLSNGDVMSNNVTGQPLADLFPNTTVLFADIAGFTAWSSQRDPPQVFTLLETLYRSFDALAKKLMVFKGAYTCLCHVKLAKLTCCRF